LTLLRSKVRSGYFDFDLEEIYSYTNEFKYKINIGRSARYVGEILIYIDDQYPSEAENWIKKSRRNR